ncbi:MULTISPECIES: hypothetical protein [Chryseobacterium]|uniref:hypothetical protein n=1 Tax=Chryseobacterium TaxID=59732 RepID=UPI000B1188AB|nr:hypothetical protein [Chryseobacterium viscerum]MCW1962002.1 hypothetical protein [Chryseobacterium viscerum]
MKNLRNQKSLSREQLKSIAGGNVQGVCRLSNGGYVLRDCTLKCPNGGYPICPA